MKNFLFVLFISTTILSCDDSNVSSSTAVSESPDWVKLEIPNGRESLAIKGDINGTLLVATFTKAFYTTDGGKHWQLSTDFQGPIGDFLQRNDTVFALMASGTDKDGQSYASTCDQYTTDYGKSWHRDITGKCNNFRSPIGIAESATGIAYRVKNNLTPTSPGSTSYYSNPSEIEKYDQSKWDKFAFPLKLKINNLYLDGSNYLYVAASSGAFNHDNCLQSPDEKSPALVYISKVSLP